MRILVTWGSKRGGTEGIARTIAEVLRAEGHEVHAEPASTVDGLDACDAVIVGGALYMNRWHHDARRFVSRHVSELRRLPVWFFSSGPLDDSADHASIPAIRQVAALMSRIGARGHKTFGGRLLPDAKGFPAAAMAKTKNGDWRNDERIRHWATEVARELPNARPLPATEPPERSLPRLFGHAVAGWALCSAAMLALSLVASFGTALVVRAMLAPLIFAVVAARYFRTPGAREPLPAAFTFVAVMALLDAAIVAGVILRSFAIFGTIVGTWLPFALVFLVTWGVGLVRETMPWPKPAQPTR